jgi:ATP-binding cassette subfamily B protein
VVFALVASLMAMPLVVTGPLVTKIVIDSLAEGDDRRLTRWVLLLLAIAVITYGLACARRYFSTDVALKVEHELRTDMFASLIRLDRGRTNELDRGQLISVATSDLQLVQGLLTLMPLAIGNVLQCVLTVGVMAYLSPLLTLITCAVVPPMWFVSMRSRRRIPPASLRAQQQVAVVASVVAAAVTGVRVVKSFGQEAREVARLRRASRELFAERLRTIRLTSGYSPILQAIPALGQIGVLALGGWMAVRGAVSLGLFVAFSAYVVQLAGPVQTLTSLVTTVQQTKVGLERVLEVIDADPDITEHPDALQLPRALAHSVEFADVTFGYGTDQPVLNGFRLAIERGETVAVIGPSGSGKSTLSLLLPRFYDVSAGAIRIGEHDIRDVSLRSLRAAIGLVPSDAFLFSDTIRANIAYGVPGATDEQVVAAAHLAQADGFIRGLSSGYDTLVGERGLTLSGGQRQRIALARAIITDPAVLVLDDATSAVDPYVEAEIHEALKHVLRGRTALVIAHSRSTLQLADRIAVVEAGRVVDVGTAEELQSRCPVYRKLLGDPEDRDVQILNRRSATHGKPQAVASGPGEVGARNRTQDQEPAFYSPHVDEKAAMTAEPGFGLRTLLKPFTLPLGAGLFLLMMDAAMGLLSPALVRYGIDEGVRRTAFGAVLTASALGLIVLIVRWAAQTSGSRLAGRTSERILYTLRIKIFAHLQRLGLDYYESQPTGRIMTRMTTDVDDLATFAQSGLVTGIVNLLTSVGILIALLVIDLRLSLMVLVFLPVLLVATLVFRRKAVWAYALSRDRIGIVNTDLGEQIDGLLLVQAFRREKDILAHFTTRSREYCQSRIKSQLYVSLFFPFAQFLSSIAVVLVMITGGARIADGSLSIGSLVAYLLYIDLFFLPLQQLSQVFDSYQQAAVSLSRIRQFLLVPARTPQASMPRPVEKLYGDIVFDSVQFAYQLRDGGSGHNALTGVDLHIRAGQTVALVGETGAGKSSIVKLIARLYDVTAGAIRIDGIDIRDLDLTQYRRRLGIVPQEAYIFPGTVRDAIAYGHPDATMTEIESAARTVGAHTFITALPQGYFHEITEGGRNLSSGQRQLIALARAELVDPDILLLDEATASLDPHAERAVSQGIERVMRRRTALIVAHRLTTAARADRLFVVDHGRIVEAGTHDQLLANGGRYAELWRAFAGHSVP